MYIIQSHNFTLYGGNEKYKIILRPLTDEHLPYLYKWNSDKEVLYWTEGDDVEAYTPEIVHKKYGGKKEECLYFAIEVNGETIGECWLQKMNLAYVKKMYSVGTDVRRIDMSIGEKQYWGKGIGTLFIGMLVDFAFNTEKVDILHCFCEDYNIRSYRVWEKNGFSLIWKEELPEWRKGDYQCHWRLTKEVYLTLPKTKLIPYDASRRAEAVQMVAEFFADHFSVSEYTEATITPEQLQAADEDFDDWLEKDSATLFFIEDNGVTSGLMLLAKHGGTVVWIENLYVKKEFRRRGIAARAIKLAEQYALEVMKAPAINMDVIPQNIDALRLYHSLGYDTLQIITVRKSLNDDEREHPIELLGFEFKI